MRLRSSTISTAVIMLPVLALPVMALAQVGPTEESQESEIFKVGASLRLRGAIRDDLKFGSTDPGNDEQYLLTQLRMNATWNPATRATVFVEIQDARIFGEEAIDPDAIPNIFVDELDLHQGYLRVDLSSGELPVDITVGRQKFAFGAQRLVSPLEAGYSRFLTGQYVRDTGLSNDADFFYLQAKISG